MIKIDKNGILTVEIPETHILPVIQVLADQNNIVDGKVDLNFDLKPPVEAVAEEEEEEDVEYCEEPVEGIYEEHEQTLGELVDEEAEDKDSEELPEYVEEDADNIHELFEDLVSYDHDLEEIDFEDKVETEEEVHGEARSVHDLSEEEQELIVRQYIREVPTKIIQDEYNVTKSALYSSLERMQIPRKGKLNKILRMVEEGEPVSEIKAETNVSDWVIDYIIKNVT